MAADTGDRLFLVRTQPTLEVRLNRGSGIAFVTNFGQILWSSRRPASPPGNREAAQYAVRTPPHAIIRGLSNVESRIACAL